MRDPRPRPLLQPGRLLALVATLAPGLPAQVPEALPQLRLQRYQSCTSHDPTGGNEDSGHYLEVNADGTRVLADFRGKGRLARLWSADPQGDIALEVDGEVRFAGPFRGLFDGSTMPFVAPEAVRFAGGAVCRVPVAFGERLRLTSPPGPGTYHQVAVLLGDEPEAPALAAAVDGGERRHVFAGYRELLALDGPAELCELRLRLVRGDPRQLWLTAIADDAAVPTLQAPLDLLLPDDLATAATPFADGWRRLLLPMPCRQRLRICVQQAAAGEAELELGYRWRPLPAGHGRGYLHGLLHRAQNRWGEPFPVLRVDGRRGHFVGLVAELCGAPAQGLSFLEGDETVVADGEVVLRGTGTEDFFDGGWYFRGNPAGSRSAAVAAIDPRLARVRAARFCFDDPLPFQRAFAFALEHGGGNDAAGSDYRTLALWYDDAAAGLPPRADALADDAPLPPPQWRDLPAAEVFADSPMRDGVAMLMAGSWPLPPARTPTGFTLLREGRPMAPTLLAAAGEVPLLQLEGGVQCDAVRLQPALPAVRSWRIVGPFAGGERRGLDRRHGPEDDSREDREYEVLGDGPRGWRHVDVREPSGVLDLDAAMGRRDHVVAFAATWLELPSAQDVVLWLGSDDALRVYVDGRAVHEHRGVRGCAPAQDRVPLHLDAGLHEVLLEVEDYAGGFGCWLRVDGDGVRCRSRRGP